MALNLKTIGKKIESIVTEYSWKDIVLYALGVGAGFNELEYVYENKLKVMPSFGTTITHHPSFFSQIMLESGMDQSGMLYSGHELICHNPIPPEGGTLTTVGGIAHIYDKGHDVGALIVSKLDTFHSDGQKLFTNIVTLFALKDGGFGGQAPPDDTIDFPDRDPDFEELAHPRSDQPLLYRLSGDLFPLHADPEFARDYGFQGVIMSGPCTLGYASRALIKHLIPDEPERLTRIRNRFSAFLYPGIPIKTQIWKTGEGTAVFKTINVETGEPVLDHGLVEWIGSEVAARRAERGGIRFDGQVAVITGAGRGLGRIYALELAKRGAKIVVNDLGGATDGMDESSSNAADDVVGEITATGGEAVASYDSVATTEGGSNIITTAVDHFGRVDILINNAGILRDKTFAKMEPEMWSGIQDVHLNGAYNVTRPAFQIMKERGYGRIVLTTSAAGLFGNYGQTNYGAAKMGLVGFMNSLKLEGAKHDIKVNTISPIATTRLTKDLLPPDLVDRLKPEQVAPLVLYLCAEQCPSSGQIYQAGLSLFNRAAMVSGLGTRIEEQGKMLSPEDVAAQWGNITSLEGAREYPDAITAIFDMASSSPADESEEKQSQVKGSAKASTDQKRRRQ